MNCLFTMMYITKPQNHKLLCISELHVYMISENITEGRQQTSPNVNKLIQTAVISPTVHLKYLVTQV